MTPSAGLEKKLGYSLQSPAKVKEGSSHPDRDGQFRHLHGLAQDFVASGGPVRVKMHDFVDPELGRVIPYGIYDDLSMSVVSCAQASTFITG